MTSLNDTMKLVDAVANDARWMPYWGWHDDHRYNDRQPTYLPALQQVRSEFEYLIATFIVNDIIGADNRALQLGLGPTKASHYALMTMFRRVVTIDEKMCCIDEGHFHGLDTHIASAKAIAAGHGPFDFLFIDAGHKLSDVDQDYFDYRDIVRPGGIIAIHDACKRPGYENEVDVWRWLTSFPEGKWTVIGSEVGIAWTRKG